MAFDFAVNGFKCGIEVHQRLDTNKLFCGCYCDPNKPGPEGRKAVLKRRLRAVAGELGELDAAAAFESVKAKEFTYSVDSASACLVEADEEPPHGVCKEALEVALQIALLLNSRVVDEVHFMRKTVVDGSAVSGFQRTALVASGGWIETTRGKVGIQGVFLEEEAAGIVERSGDSAEYRLDRLGIPLVEIATDASIKDGGHCKEVAEKIGLLLRSTGRVQRGIGTIRQDLNVSIKGGAKVEIKGAQELADIPLLVENEAARQLAFALLRKELRSHSEPEPRIHAIDLSHVFASTKCGFVSKALADSGMVFGIRLKGFAMLLGREVMPDHRVGTELSGRAKAASGVGGIIHSDEDLGKYRFSTTEISAVRKILECGDNDAFVLCVGPENAVVRALSAVFERAMQCFDELEGETRAAFGNKSVFARPLPGAHRMYPETDVPPVRLTHALIKSIELPESFEDKKKRFLKMGLNEELATKVLRESDAVGFEGFVATGAEPTFVAATLVETLKSLRRDGVPIEKIGSERLKAFFAAFAKNEFVKAAAPLLLTELALKQSSVQTALDSRGLCRIGGTELKEAIDALKKRGLAGKQLFSEAMKRHRLNVDAGELVELISG
ncbi:TPA: Glu-tRNA(Gln) amidotransferase subunit GatE [Candidatus Micrarchaeota archaeon]|nr:MAG: glutamyl-tRNA(Gln) amidotransferase subunit E [Candidatus Micrarchaeota archaeon CG1_02_51_15]HII39007.1 Glu-tRNA(Gln) amidotransferase subunit GatE [Candidatus Micrarchaeota archaeon]